MHVLASSPAGDRGPEIIEHVTVEADALAGLEANGPHPDAVALRHQRVADTRVGIVLLALEFRGDFRRPRRFHRGLRLLVQHRQGHGIPPSLARYIPTFARQETAGSSGMRKAKRRRGLIVGGSMSGLLAALLLRRAGWDGDVFERVESELAGRGAGIVAQPDLIETLRRLGIDATDLGVEITTRKILDTSGRLAGEFACPQVLTAWERVYRLLRDALAREHYHRGRGVSGFVQTERSVLAQFGDGGAAEGDLLVGADGLRSTIRQQCLPQLVPGYVGYVAWRALIAEAALTPGIHRELFNFMTFCLPPGEQCVG